MKDVVGTLVSEVMKISLEESISLLEVPSSDKNGDYSFPCFSMAKLEKKSPLVIAEDLSKRLVSHGLPNEVSNVSFNGGYINFFVDKKILAESVLKLVKKKAFGEVSVGKGRSVGIEFSQPNTHKAFHVGHIRGTSYGESLSRIFEACGETVVRMNYSGDTGMHIAKWIWGYGKFHFGEELKDDEKWISKIYVESVSKLEGNKEGELEVLEINKKLETREDPGINSLWEKTRKLSIDSWTPIFEQLNTKFERHYFESEVEVSGKEIAEDLLGRKIAKKDDAIFMDLKKYNLGVWVLLRKDGTVLYSAKDLALAYLKEKEYSLDRNIVLVAVEQKMHFEQLNKTLELMGYPKASSYGFLNYGLVRFPEGKMSSRTGNNVLYSDLMEKTISEAKKNLEGKEIEKKAVKVAVASIKYSMLKQDSKKNIIFDPNASIAFEGDTGTYLLYSYARASSIKRRVKSKKKVEIVDLKDEEIRLLKKINSFEDVILDSYERLAPNLIANYTFELATQFNEFYHSCPVLGSIEEGFRLALVDAFRITIKKSLDLLGIDTLEEM